MQGWKRFLSLCSRCKGEEELNALFELFLTIEERRDIGLRALLIDALLEGKKTQREIAADLGISIAKITRGSNALKIISPKLKERLLP
ncbi:MAG: trp operon repressor [Parachlamydiales bacterium]